MTRAARKVLFIGYDRNLTVLHGGALQKLGGYEVAAADSAEWGRQLYSGEHFDVVVLGSGLTKAQRQLLSDELREKMPTTRVIMLPEAVLPEQIARLLGDT